MVAAHEEFEIVATAGNAGEALDALKTVRVDIILLDVEMPGASGLEALPDIIRAGAGRARADRLLHGRAWRRDQRAGARARAPPTPCPSPASAISPAASPRCSPSGCAGSAASSREARPGRRRAGLPITLRDMRRGRARLRRARRLDRRPPRPVRIPAGAAGADRRADPGHPASAGDRSCPISPASSKPPRAGSPMSPRTARCCVPTSISTSRRATPISASSRNGGQVRVRLDRKRAPVRLPALGRSDARLGRRRLWPRRRRRDAERHGPRRPASAAGGSSRAAARCSPRTGTAPPSGACPAPSRKPGLACAVLPPADLARRVGQRGRGAGMEVSDTSRRILASLLEARTGQQLAHEPALADRDRALASIMRERGYDSVDQLVSRLVARADPGLQDAVIEALLNNETYFFRDKLPFDLLIGGPDQAAGEARAPRRKRLSIWCAGCSSGQEAYSLAMSFADEKLRWAGWTDRDRRHRSLQGRDRPREGRDLFAVRGAARPAGHADDPLVRRARRRRLADFGGAAQAGPLRGAQHHRYAALAGPLRHHPVPQPPALFLARHAARSPSTAWPRRSRRTAR